MKNTLLFSFGIALVSLSSCSRANYSFNNNTPAYLGVERAQYVAAAPVAAPAEAASAVASIEAPGLVPAATPAHQAAVALARPAVAPAKTAAPAATAAPEKVLTKANIKAVKQAARHGSFMSPNEIKAGGKSQLVAAILCFFLGFLGVHDFYLGRVGKGIVQILLTLIGVGFILVIIDFIRILIGTEKPKDGEYAKTL